MTEQEYISSEFYGFQCKFIFKNGDELTGIISTFLNATKPNEYQLISSDNLDKLGQFIEEKNALGIEEICIPIDFSQIVSAEKVWW